MGSPERDSPATVVSVTPLAIERDSRTFKQAASLARFGYRSIVVEGEASGSGADLPFELITIEGALPAPVALTPDRDEGGEPSRPPEPRQEPEPAASAVPSRGPLGRLRHGANVLIWHLFKRPKFVRTRWYLDWNRRAHAALPDADLYVAHSYMLCAAVLRQCLGRRRRRFVYDAHDSYFQMRPSQLEGLGRPERIWAGIERLAVRRAAGFTTVGEGLADLLEERHHRRPVVMRNCHDRRLDREVDAGIRQRTGVGEDGFLLVSVGNDKDGMTLPAALEALARLPARFHLAYVGRGHERHRELVSGLGLERRAHHLPAVPAPEVVPLIGDADAALIPYRPLTRNYVNALPNGFFQSLGAGLPLLYPTSLVEVTAIAERHEAGLGVDTTDPGSIAAALEQLGGDRSLLDRLRANAVAAGEQESWEREEAILRDLTAEVLGTRADAPDATLSGRSSPGARPRARIPEKGPKQR